MKDGLDLQPNKPRRVRLALVVIDGPRGITHF